MESIVIFSKRKAFIKAVLMYPRKLQVVLQMGFALVLMPIVSLPSANAKEIDQEIPLPGIFESVQPDNFTGSLNVSIPIEVPSGRRGLQPSLALTYGSANGNGWVGVGWKLEIGDIERQTRVGVDFNANEYSFQMSGVSTHLVSTGGTEYRAKIESGFTRVVKQFDSPDSQPYFVATDRNGTQYRFGYTSASRMSDSGRIFKWSLDRVLDTFGNYMTVSYMTDLGQQYIDHIDYTGNGSLAPGNTVKFYLESRTDAFDLYVPNYRVQTRYRLKGIDVRANNQRVRAYKFSYILSPNSSRSILNSVQQFGKDASIDASGTITGTALPALGFSAQQALNQFDPDYTALQNFGTLNGYTSYNVNPRMLADVTGDGIADAVAFASNGVYVARGDGAIFGSAELWVSGYGTGNGWTNMTAFPRSLADVNADGKADIVGFASDGVYVSLSNGSSFSAPTRWLAEYGTSAGGWTDNNTYPRMLTDVNGDGKADIVGFASSGAMVSISTGTAFTPGALWVAAYGTVAGGWSNNSTHPRFLADVNGDGLSDVVGFSSSGVMVSLSTGTSFSASLQWIAGYGTASGWTNNSDYPRMLADVNGDGKADVVGFFSSGVTVSVSTGAAFTAGSTWLNDFGTGAGWTNTLVHPRFMGDANGDGRDDIIGMGDGGVFVALSRGDSFGAKALWRGNFGTSTGWSDMETYPRAVIDVTGDGKVDVVGFGTTFTALAPGNGPSPDMLLSMTNGTGGVVSVTYLPTPWVAHSQTLLPFPFQTISSISFNDSNGNASTTNYVYSGGFYHLAEHEFRGFSYVKATGPIGPNGEQAITETWFHQGNDIEPNVNDPYGAVGYMKGKPYQVLTAGPAGINGPHQQVVTYYLSNTAVPYFNPVRQLDVYTGENFSTYKQVRSVYSYDPVYGLPYGNITREDQYGDLSDSADDRTIVRTFSPNTTAWIVSQPTSESLYQGIGTATLVSSTNFYYDGTATCDVASTVQTPTQGSLTRVVRTLIGGASNPETRYAYDSYGNRFCTRDANGIWSQYLIYDDSHIFPLYFHNGIGMRYKTYVGVQGQPTTNGLYGQVLVEVDFNGVPTYFSYDVFGRPLNVTFYDNSAIKYAYNNFGTVNAQHIQKRRGDASSSTYDISTSTYFDGLGRPILDKSDGPDMKTIASRTIYDVRGAVRQTSLPYFDGIESATGRWRAFTYDHLGRIMTVTNPDSSRLLMCHSNWETVSIDANNHRRRETRDAYSRLIRIDEYQGTFTSCTTDLGLPYGTTRNQYNVAGNLRYVIDASSNQTEMRYDSLERKTFMHDPDMGNWTYEYDAVGNLTKQTDAKGQNIFFQYDAVNRRRQKDYGTQKAAGSGDVVYTYDGVTSFGKGRLTSVVDASGTSTFYYDTLGRPNRMDKTVAGTTYIIGTSYDLQGRVASVTYPDGSVVNHEYNGPLLKRVYEGATNYAQYAGYNAFGQPGTLTFGNGVATTYTYSNNQNALCPQQNLRPCTTKTTASSLTYQNLQYSYDSGGNVTAITDTINGNQTFGYDGLDRLTSAIGPYGSLGYIYNNIGNLLDNSQVGTYFYPASGSSSVRPHAVFTAGPNTYTYDNNGNMQTGAGRTLSYDYENRPTSITSAGVTTTFVYDGDGGRVIKTRNGVTTLYVNKLYECVPSTCVKYVIVGGQRIAMKQVTNGVVDYFHSDHLGSTSVMTTGAGAQEQGLTYYPFGGTRTNTGTVNVPYKYTGKEFDETGLYFYEARYYDPTIGRFISADTIVPDPIHPQTFNRYSYVINNPLRYTDPTGHNPFFAPFPIFTPPPPVIDVPIINVTAPPIPPPTSNVGLPPVGSQPPPPVTSGAPNPSAVAPVAVQGRGLLGGLRALMERVRGIQNSPPSGTSPSSGDNSSSPAVVPVADSPQITGGCISASGNCSVRGRLTDIRSGYRLDLSVTKGSDPVYVEIRGRRVFLTETEAPIYDRRLGDDFLQSLTVSGSTSLKFHYPEPARAGKPATGYLDLLHGPGLTERYRVPGYHTDPKAGRLP